MLISKMLPCLRKQNAPKKVKLKNVFELGKVSSFAFCIETFFNFLYTKAD
jgi:hypothetical protein